MYYLLTNKELIKKKSIKEEEKKFMFDTDSVDHHLSL